MKPTEGPFSLEYFTRRPSYLLKRAQLLASLSFGRLAPATALTLSQLEALRAAQTWPTLDQSGIALSIGLDKATVTLVLDGLVNRKLVKRRASRLDRRRKFINIAPAGEATLSAGLSCLEATNSELQKSLSEERSCELQGLLASLILHNNDAAVPWSPPGETPSGDAIPLEAALTMPMFSQISFRVRRCSQIASALFAAETRAFSITSGQYALLYMLGCPGKWTQAALARTLMVDRSSIALVLRILEARGAIAKSKCSSDTRLTVLSLTDAGYELVGEVQPLSEAAERNLLGALSPKAAGRMLDNLQGLVAPQ